MQGYVSYVLRQVFSELVSTGVVIPKEEVAPPTVPMDYNWARVGYYFDFFLSNSKNILCILLFYYCRSLV